MKLPSRPPTDEDLWKIDEVNPRRLSEILGIVSGPLVDGEYLHWDKLRFRTPPAGLDRREWWWGLKCRREGRPIPLLDKSGSGFSFHLVDSLQEIQHRIDLSMGGSVGMSDQIPNPESKRTYLVRSLIEEAFTSSQLEGAASTRAIAKMLIRRERPPETRGERMILNNYRTMQRIGAIRGERLSKGLLCEIHAIITEGTLDEPDGAGRFRREDEHRVVGDESGTIFHDPPDASTLDRRVEAMCAFANGESLATFVHPAIRSMILHFWLAYDHPFVDGNGRAARALFYWSMLRHGYWLFEFVSISQVILRSPIQYGRAYLHTETDGNDLTYFLIYHADVMRKSIDNLYEYIRRRSGELSHLESNLLGLAHLNFRQKRLIGHAIRHPGARYTVESHRASHGVSRATSNNDLLDLSRKGLLLQIRDGKEMSYLAVPDLEQRLKLGG